eukprot:TRINITY_DN5728_c0_g1_i2.p1 TRINITY_DN5728_c0_g1~~TRINITY_DN5728_c0_g1_i2.p1  ORF type:complete len:207 (+),score=40.46 TRINITY_DN5728_c0_g1_i2:40-660(+)
MGCSGSADKNAGTSNYQTQGAMKVNNTATSEPKLTKKEYSFKILLVGDSAVGKSAVILRFTDRKYGETFVPTIGVDFRQRTIEVNGTTAKLQVWDTAGQENFHSITTSFFRGAHGIILVYDVTNASSFESIPNWIRDIDQHASENVQKILIGNKSDKEDREITYEEGKDFADQMNMDFFETSAKDSINIDETFQSITSSILDQLSI